MFDINDAYSFDDTKIRDFPIVKPNRITGEGRMKYRPSSAYKKPDLKMKQHRKMAKKSKRQNRRRNK